MEKEKLKELIVEHKDRFLARDELIPREVQADIVSFFPQREIIILTGVRRSGKSSLMRLLCGDLLKTRSVPENNILYLNFEDERFVPFKVQDFETLYETFIELENPRDRKYLFLDEIQNIPGWERWLNRLYEFEDVKIFVTGSNASLLSSETATALTGRNRQIIVWPFSFREFLSLRGISLTGKSIYKLDKRTEIKRLFREYTELGGFPEILKTGDITLLEQYYRDILYRDVIARYSIKNIKEIKELTLYLASNPATVQSYRGLRDFIGGRSINTVKNYITALNDVYLFFYLDLFDYSVKRQIYNPSKTFCVDTALAGAVSFNFSKNLGHVYENMIFIELKRQNKEIYYGRTHKGKEVDFILKEGLRIAEVIQVCVSLADEKTLQRELQSMTDVCDELIKGNSMRKVKELQLTIITQDEERLIKTDHGEVRAVPIWKWLLPVEDRGLN